MHSNRVMRMVVIGRASSEGDGGMVVGRVGPFECVVDCTFDRILFSDDAVRDAQRVEDRLHRDPVWHCPPVVFAEFTTIAHEHDDGDPRSETHPGQRFDGGAETGVLHDEHAAFAGQEQSTADGGAFTFVGDLDGPDGRMRIERGVQLFEQGIGEVTHGADTGLLEAADHRVYGRLFHEDPSVGSQGKTGMPGISTNPGSCLMRRIQRRSAGYAS